MTTDAEVLYLDAEDALRLHARIFQADVTWARGQLRDVAALESALARPRQHAAYQAADLAAQAAVLAHGIAESQCFVDGNKRTALIAMTTFLAVNGWDVNAQDAVLAESILGFALGVGPEALADTIRASWSPRP